MFKLKTQLSSLDNLNSAVRYRVQDYSYLDFGSKQIDNGAAAYLKKENLYFTNPLKVSQPLNSATYRDFLRDLRFLIVFNNLELDTLSQEIKSLSIKNLKKIKALQREVDILDSDLLELEYKFYKDYDFVHYNNFSKRADRIAEELTEWNYDFKTGLSLDTSELAEVYAHAGVTLPILHSQQLPFSSCIIVGEETDVGDTKKPLIRDNPNHCIMDNKLFRYVIIRKEFDETRRKYNHTQSHMTLLLSFSSAQLLNYFEVVPAGVNSVQISDITYINEANEEIALGAEVIQVPSGIRIFTEAIRAKALKLKFRQLSPVSKQSLTDVGSNSEMNLLLEGLSWNSRFKDNKSKEIEGRVFDFSIKEIKAYLNYYNNLGYYCSTEQHVKGIATAKLISSLQELPVSVAANVSEQQYNLPTGSTTTEFYLGVKSKQKGKIVFNDLIPIPDTYPIQFESLALSGGTAKLKLYPDLLYAVDKTKVLSVVMNNAPRLTVTTVTQHGLQADDEFTMLAPNGTNLSNNYTVFRVIDDFSFQIKIQDWSNILEIDEETKPNTYIYLNVSPRFNVYRNEVPLVIGRDFQLGLGDGFYYSDWDLLAYQAYTSDSANAGDFVLKFTSPSYKETYRVEYRPLKNQSLSRDGLVRLRNNSVVFSKKFKNTISSIQTIALLRSSIGNYYTTSILVSYILGIRRYE